MKYYVLEGSFAEVLPNASELKTAIDEHLKYLQKGFRSGVILLSGPKEGAGGGVIVLKCNDSDEVEQFCSNDPLVQAGVQEYHVIEFTPYDYQQELKSWFSNTPWQNDNEKENE